MTSAAFRTALEACRFLHDEIPALTAFAPFPDDLAEAHFQPQQIPAATLFEQTFAPQRELAHPLTRALLDASPEAFWRETYKDTDIGQDFLDRFGCYCVIGPDAPWSSTQLWAFMVTMPANLWYPWHHHPAEEIYVVVDGQADFLRDGHCAKTLKRGDASLHASNQPHAMQTRDQPVVAYVAWRNGFGIPPVLTPNRSGP